MFAGTQKASKADLCGIHAEICRICNVSHRSLSASLPRQLWLALIESEKPKNHFEIRLPFLIQGGTIYAKLPNEEGRGMQMRSFMTLSEEDILNSNAPPAQRDLIALYSASLTLTLLHPDGKKQNTHRVWEPPHDVDALLSVQPPQCGIKLVISQIRFTNPIPRQAADLVFVDESNNDDTHSAHRYARKTTDWLQKRLAVAWTRAADSFNDATTSS